MKINKLKQRIAEKKACYGVISPTTDPTICEYVGLSGLDFYMIDAEHGAISPSDITNMIRACEAVGVMPLARVGDLNEKLILQYMDAGIMGIMMPSVATEKECAALVNYMKYPPVGNRGLGPVRSADYMMGAMNQLQYVEFANQQTLVLPQVEDIKAMKHLKKMANTEGVDGFIIGPRDLAMTMGFYDGPAHPEVAKVMDEIFDIVLSAGKIIGTVAANSEQADKLVAKGATIILNSVQGLLASSAKAFMANRVK
jgi:4-hydroxy-2-oxoheptanedioate aldolase